MIELLVSNFFPEAREDEVTSGLRMENLCVLKKPPETSQSLPVYLELKLKLLFISFFPAI